MKVLIKPFLLIALLHLFYNTVSAQCDVELPELPKKIDYARRLVTIDNVIMNGKKRNYLEVQKGQQVSMSAHFKAEKNGDYCPGCIVQIYWGIHDFTSTCAKNFHGYNFSKINSTYSFKAPEKDGVYYITIGGSLQYSCKNHKKQPFCDKNKAFAVLKVGNPRPEKLVTLSKTASGDELYLSTNQIKHGCFKPFNSKLWYFNNKLIENENGATIQAKKDGVYRVVWKNCLGDSASAEIKINEKGEVAEELPKKSELSNKIKTEDNFVLENLVFDLGKYTLKEKAKEELDEMSKILKNNPSMQILLEGHTDKKGSKKLNQKLSEDRVKEVKRYLVGLGISKKRIKVKGWGDTKPLIITNDVDESQKNRRVEISILKR